MGLLFQRGFYSMLVAASLAIFRRAGMDALRRKSIALTGYFEALLRERLDDVLEIATPREPERRGCQLSLRVRRGREAGRALFDHLKRSASSSTGASPT